MKGYRVRRVWGWDCHGLPAETKDVYKRQILTLLSLQAIINLGGMVAIMPLTGVPLPFISYGGSSLLIFYSLMGIVISVARRTN